MLPTGILIDQDVTKVTAEGVHGSFCLLPRHIDYCSALPPGLLSFENKEGKEIFVAVDNGMLVKTGEEVLVSTQRAIPSPDLESVRDLIETEFAAVDETERKTQAAMANLEASLVRRFLEWGENE